MHTKWQSRPCKYGAWEPVKKRSVLILCLMGLASGVVFFLIQRNLLLIHFTLNPFQKSLPSADHDATVSVQTKIYFWKNESWHHEDTAIIFKKNNQHYNFEQLLRQWIKILQQESLLSPHITLESVALSTPGSDAFVSFDRSLFSSDQSIRQKWLIIESLFKTLHRAHINIQTIMLLVHDNAMDDDHLDFSMPLVVQERL